MAEMDIYMRRRLVALGGLVAFFIIFVLLVKSCGDDDPAPSTTTSEETGATGETGAALTTEAFIEQGDAICGPANTAVSEIDPEDPAAAQQEYDITRGELKQLNSLELAEPDPSIEKFLADLSAVVDALEAKAQGEKNADVAAEDAAQLEIDAAEVEARAAGKRAGFQECGAFLDAGEAPSGGGGGGNADATADTGTVAPADTGGVTTPSDTETAPPATPPDTGTAPPATPPDTGGGGITP
jgi:hypothetical protein